VTPAELPGLLQASPLVGNIQPLEKSPWRGPVGAGLGVVAGIVAAMIAAAIVIAVYAILAASSGVDVGQALNGLMESKAATVTFATAIAAVATIAFANAALGYTLVALAGLMVKRRLMAYITAAPRFRWKHLVFGMAATPLVFAPLAWIAVRAGLDIGADPRGPPIVALTDGLAQPAIYLVACVSLLVLAASVEEVVFRGWLLRQITAWIGKPWAAALIASALFAAIHFPRDLTGWAALALMGLSFSYMALRLGGVEYAIGAHAAHNSMIILFLQPMSFDAAYPGVGVGDFLFTVVMCLGYAGFAEWLARREARGLAPSRDTL
jgi:membrane protease YdiL (CAAX protease family)